MFRQVCTIEPSLFNTTSGMHRNMEIIWIHRNMGRHLVMNEMHLAFNWCTHRIIYFDFHTICYSGYAVKTCHHVRY